MNFEFTDVTMKVFCHDLNAWIEQTKVSELEQMKVCKIQFKVSIETLYKLSEDAMSVLIDSFPYEYFTLKVTELRGTDDMEEA